MTPPLPLDRVPDLVGRIHAAGGPMVVLYVAGGGTEVFPWLLARGGGSATLLAGRVPYDPADFHALLGANPGRLVDARAARGLAMAALRHALRLRPDLGTDGVVGIAATGKLSRGADDRPGRAHEVHLALQSARSTEVRSVVLPLGGDRFEQERVNALLILNLIARGRGVDELPIPPGNLRTTTESRTDAVGAEGIDLGPLLGGAVPWLAHRLGVSGASGPGEVEPPGLILPGSFRPLHDGHRRMALLASELVGHPCAFELSVFHPEKPPLDYVSIAHRVAGFAGFAATLLLTDAPTYLEKARSFPGATFVVGFDTAARIVEPRWYGGVAARDAMLDELEALGTRFLVFGRVDDSGRFRDPILEAFDDPHVARFVARSMRGVAESAFRADLSSTALREALGTDFP